MGCGATRSGPKGQRSDRNSSPALMSWRGTPSGERVGPLDREFIVLIGRQVRVGGVKDHYFQLRVPVFGGVDLRLSVQVNGGGRRRTALFRRWRTSRNCNRSVRGPRGRRPLQVTSGVSSEEHTTLDAERIGCSLHAGSTRALRPIRARANWTRTSYAVLARPRLATSLLPATPRPTGLFYCSIVMGATTSTVPALASSRWIVAVSPSTRAWVSLRTSPYPVAPNSTSSPAGRATSVTSSPGIGTAW